MLAMSRAARKDEKKREEHRQKLGLPDQVKLLPHSAQDAEVAALMSFGDSQAFAKSRYGSLP